MGLMRFRVRAADRIADSDLKRVYIAGPDELPYHGRAYLSGDLLHVERREDASGVLCVPWMLDEHGPWMLGTTTLMEREQPYTLEVELARGLVFRARDQMAAWQMLGLKPPEDLLKLLAEATTAFSRAAVMQVDPPAAVSKALEAIALGAAATIRLSEVYAEQALEVRTNSGAKLPTLMGCRVSRPPASAQIAAAVTSAFSIMSVPCGWKDIEPTEAKPEWGQTDNLLKWAQENRLRVSLGPLLEFSEARIPEWAYLFEGEFETLSSQMVSHVEACVKRYRGRVNLWNVASQVNRSRVLGLTDEQRLQLVAKAVRRVRELDPNTPVTVCFDQPWGESMAVEPSDLASIEFADALERADLGIAGFGIQFDMEPRPGGSTPRSPLAFSRLLDAWSLRLELPLLIMLAVPGGEGAGLSVAAQGDWVRSYLPVMLAKNCVQVVLWNELEDDGPLTVRHGGLVDDSGQRKPALAALRELRSAFLN